MAIRLTVQLRVKPDKTEEFEAIVGAAAQRVRAEDKGCEQYDLFRSTDEVGRYVMVEAWATKEDMKAHLGSPGMQELAAAGPLMAGRMVSHQYKDRDKEKAEEQQKD